MSGHDSTTKPQKVSAGRLAASRQQTTESKCWASVRESTAKPQEVSASFLFFCLAVCRVIICAIFFAIWISAQPFGFAWLLLKLACLFCVVSLLYHHQVATARTVCPSPWHLWQHAPPSPWHLWPHAPPSALTLTSVTTRPRRFLIYLISPWFPGPDYHRWRPKALHILEAHFGVAHIDVATIFLLESQLQFGC